MHFNDRLYVEIVPLESDHPPHPHPIVEGKFDRDLVYKVLGVYNPSETSECYLMLANPQREIWFIPQRHVRVYQLIDSEEFFLWKSDGSASGSANGNGCRAAIVATSAPSEGHRSPAP